MPTLVLARGWPNHEKDREAAEAIEGSTFVLLPGEDRATFAGNQDDLVESIRDFVGAGPALVPTETLLRAVLFTDIVGSTEHLAKVGDAAWRELLASHDARARALIEEHGGRFIKNTGDGVLASFEGPAQAVRTARAFGIVGATTSGSWCAPACTSARSSPSTATCIGRDRERRGPGRRVGGCVGGLGELDRQGPRRGESGLTFEDAGEHELKGVPDRWHLYRVVG